jgi:hypothetical protein
MKSCTTGVAEPILGDKKTDWLQVKGWLDEKDREAYRTFLMQTDTLMDQKIRMNTSTGRPLGSEYFLSELENKLCRKILPGKAGRPKKQKEINTGSVPLFLISRRG